MLDAFIIEQLRKREEREEQDQDRPVLELPVDDHDEPRRRDPAADDNRDNSRGVVVIDL